MNLCIYWDISQNRTHLFHSSQKQVHILTPRKKKTSREAFFGREKSQPFFFRLNIERVASEI